MDIKSDSTINFKVGLVLSEEEARALQAFTVYGIKAFLKVFYEHLGTSALKPHEKGVHSLFESIRDELPKHLKRMDSTRAAFREKLV